MILYSYKQLKPSIMPKQEVPQNGVVTPKLSAEDKELKEKIDKFDEEFKALQERHKLRVIAQVVFPGGAILQVPIQVQLIK